MSAKGKKHEEAHDAEVVQESGMLPDAGAHAAIDQAAQSQGRRARASFMMKNFVDPDWIMKNVVAKGKGTKVMVGRVIGIVTGTKEKKGSLPNGELSVSVVLEGTFETESYLDGEISAPSMVYFPNAFAKSVEAIFAADQSVKAVQIDCDVGVEATGKGIPYAWVIVNFVESEHQSPLKKLKAGRATPALAHSAPKQLTSA